ncbi:MAG: hypothetical protein ACO1SV_08175 [Fimbriimonas sp.]
MNDLSTLPASVRYQLERAQNLVQQDRPQEAQSLFREAATTLARTNPELCGALMASSLGYTELTLSQTDQWSETTKTDKHLLGVRYGHNVKTVTNTKTTTRTISLSGPGPNGGY